MTDFSKLREPFAPETISWRVGSTNQEKTKGLALAYIDARDVQDRLDAVVGPENWQNRFPHANGKTVCEIAIKVDGEWVTKSDGAGDSDVEAEKGAMSDAFKRAGVKWGIGRYLYDLDSPWVDIEPRGKSYVIKKEEYPRLRKLLAKNGGGVSTPQQPPASASRSDAEEQASPLTAPEQPKESDALAKFLSGVDPKSGKKLTSLQLPIPGMKEGKPNYEAYATALKKAIEAAPDFNTLNTLWGDNSRNVTYLTQNRPELRTEVEALADARSLALAPPQTATEPPKKGKKK